MVSWVDFGFGEVCVRGRLGVGRERGGGDVGRTPARGAKPLRFPKEAIHLPHLIETLFQPRAVVFQNLDDFLSERLEQFGHRTQIVNGMRSRHGGGVDGRQTQEQLTMSQLVRLALVFVGSVHHPLEQGRRLLVPRIFLFRFPAGIDYGHDDLLCRSQVSADFPRRRENGGHKGPQVWREEPQREYHHEHIFRVVDRRLEPLLITAHLGAEEHTSRDTSNEA